MLLAVIAACEVAFWVTLALGLLFRYGLRWRRTGLVFLALAPTVDLVLLIAGGIDLAHGAKPTYHHWLAAIFLGCSVMFGHRMIRWADSWAAHWLAGAPRPTKPPKGSPEHVRYERRGWLLHAGAWAIGCGLMLAGGLLAGDPYALLEPVRVWTIVLAVDALFSLPGPSKRRARQQDEAGQAPANTAGTAGNGDTTRPTTTNTVAGPGHAEVPAEHR